jgi:hypothetical protein
MQQTEEMIFKADKSTSKVMERNTEKLKDM